MGITNWFKSKTKLSEPAKTEDKQTFNPTKTTIWQKIGASGSNLNACLDELQQALISIDAGAEFTDKTIEKLRKQCKNNDSLPSIIEKLKIILKQGLMEVESIATGDDLQHLRSILVVGINGVGKTTTIAKLGYYFQQSQQAKVVFAAGDTFRAAAIAQLQVWGERQNSLVISQKPGADSASVIFDAITAAKARKANVLIADTAGRLHTQQNLMQELAKVKRVMQKADGHAPTDIWLVLDGTLGQNSLIQAAEFHQLLQLTGIIITKLDGSAKGGIIFAIAEQLKIPVKFIGVGEQMTDLQAFNAGEFVEACFTE